MLAPLVFLILAIIAGVYGFSGKAVAAAGIAKILFLFYWCFSGLPYLPGC